MELFGQVRNKLTWLEEWIKELKRHSIEFEETKF